MVKVKFCGNQSKGDLAATADADAVGFIVATPESSRNIAPNLATQLSSYVPLFTSTVAVTTEKNRGRLRNLTKKIRPDYLQLHSELSPERIEKINSEIKDEVSIISLLTVAGPPKEIRDRARELAKAPVKAILLDSKAGGRAGGTGKVHDWKISREIREILHPIPVILAGGLNPENVGEAIKKVQPSCVDAATGVEEDGEKSRRKARRFLEEVNKSET